MWDVILIATETGSVWDALPWVTTALGFLASTGLGAKLVRVMRAVDHMSKLMSTQGQTALNPQTSHQSIPLPPPDPKTEAKLQKLASIEAAEERRLLAQELAHLVEGPLIAALERQLEAARATEAEEMARLIAEVRAHRRTDSAADPGPGRYGPSSRPRA